MVAAAIVERAYAVTAQQDFRSLITRGTEQVHIRSAVFTTFSILAAAVVTAVAPMSAHAASTKTTAATHNTVRSVAGGTRPDFAAQVRSASLTSSQASALQAEVNGYLAKMGGTQVAANKIDLNGKGVLVLALPGESRARDLSSSTPQQTYYCQVGHFCAYQGPLFTGNVLDWYYCNTQWMPWAQVGSYDDEQYPFTTTTFHEGRNGDESFWAVTRNASFDWTPVLSVTVC